MTFQPPPPPPPGGTPPPPPGQPPQGVPPQQPMPPAQGYPPPQQPPPPAQPMPPAQGYPPPAPAPAPGGAPSQWGPPAGQPVGRGSGSFDPKSVNNLDWGILAAGVLAFLLSFIDYYSGVDVTVGGHTTTVDNVGSASAWHEIFGGGFFGWFAMLFAIAGAVVIALELFMPHVKLPFPNRLLGLALFAAATLFEIIAIFVTPGYSDGGFGGQSYSASINHGFGFWASLIVIIAGLVLSYMRFTQSGGKLPIGGGTQHRG